MDVNLRVVINDFQPLLHTVNDVAVSSPETQAPENAKNVDQKPFGTSPWTL